MWGHGWNVADFQERIERSVFAFFSLPLIPGPQQLEEQTFSLGILEATETNTEATLQETDVWFCPGKAPGDNGNTALFASLNSQL